MARPSSHWTTADIAKQYGVSLQTARKWVRRMRQDWGWVHYRAVRRGRPFTEYPGEPNADNNNYPRKSVVSWVQKHLRRRPSGSIDTTINETPQVKSGGRPRKISRDDYTYCLSTVLRLRGECSQSTAYLAVSLKRAIKVLHPHKHELPWLFPQEKRNKFRQGVLTELGRIRDPEDMKALAVLVCAADISARQAIAWLAAIRRARTDRQSLRWHQGGMVTQRQQYLNELFELVEKHPRPVRAA